MMKLNNKNKQFEIRDFILELFMSSISFIEKPKDIINRACLK